MLTSRSGFTLSTNLLGENAVFVWPVHQPKPSQHSSGTKDWIQTVKTLVSFLLSSSRLPVASGILLTCPLSELRSYSVFIGCRSSCLCQYMCWNVERGQSVSQSVSQSVIQSVSLSVGVWLLVFCLCLSCNISRPPRCTRTPRLPPASCQFCFPERLCDEATGRFVFTDGQWRFPLPPPLFPLLLFACRGRDRTLWSSMTAFYFLFFPFLIYFLSRLVCVCW